MSVLGIDFGTDACYVSVARAGGIETIANDYSLRNTPSCISFGEKTRVMGVAAKNQQTTNLKNTVVNFKRFLGRQFRDPVVQQEIQRNLPFSVVEQSDGSVGVQVRYQNEQQTFSAEQISAMMFTKLRDIADAAIGGRTIDCVLSAPSYFTDSERRALLDAASIAGLNVLKLLNDSTAVALAYGLYKQDLPAPEEKPRNVFFVDFGYACMQIYAASFNRGKLKMLCCVSDPSLGGRDLDLALAEHFREEFKTKYKMDVGSNQRAWLRLHAEVEKLKKQMSANSTQLPFNIECLMDDKDVSSTMKRADFEQIIAPLLQRIENLMQQALKESGLKPLDVYAVEIVGGSSRVPAVKNLIKNVFDINASTTLNQDEAVSRGCALQCAMLSPAFKVREFSISDIQVYPVILKWRGPNQEEGLMEVFPKYHSVPFSKMLTFYRTDPFTLEAYYDGDVPIGNKFIGQYRIQDVKPLPSGESSKVKVKARINLHGVFVISSASLMEPMPPKEEEPMETGEGKADPPKSPGKEAQNGPTDEQARNGDKMETEEAKNEEEKSSGKDDKKSKKPGFRTVDLPVESLVFQLSKEKLNTFTEVEGQLIANDKMEKERADARNAVEEYVYEMRGKVHDALGDFFAEADRETFLKALEETENWLYEDGEDCAKNVYVEKLRQLRLMGDPAVKRHRECEERPRAFDELGAALQQCRKVLDLYGKKDERYDHIDQSEMEKVAKIVSEKEAWFDTALAANGAPKHLDPPIYVSQIRHEKQDLDSTVQPIINKPKPKPKVETPPEDASSKEATNKTEEQKAQQQQPDSTAAGAGEAAMEVDS